MTAQHLSSSFIIKWGKNGGVSATIPVVGRPPLELGTAGEVRIYPQAGGFRARVLYRDYDGKTRDIERTGKTRGAAQRSLTAAIRDRARVEGAEAIRADTALEVVADQWFRELSEAGRSPSTLQAYRERLDNQVLPALGSVRVRELTVGLVDRHLNWVKAKHGNAVAKQTKSVLSGICGLATRHDALVSNPCRDVSRISTKPRKAPRAMSVDEVKKLRAWLSEDAKATRRDLPDLVAFMVATGLRIGEALGVTWADVDLVNGTVAVRGTVLRIKGKGLIVKPSPKSVAGERTLELPVWATAMLQRRANECSPSRAKKSAPVFPAPLSASLRDPANTRRGLREAFREAEMAGLTSHSFRKTVATLMDEAGVSARLTADQLGHAKPSMTTDVYYGRRTRVTGAAAVLEALDG